MNPWWCTYWKTSWSPRPSARRKPAKSSLAPYAILANQATALNGILPDAQLSANVALRNASQTFSGANTFNNAANSFTGNGAGLTSLNANSINSGTLSDARLSANVALRNASQSFSGGNTFNSSANSFTGDGAGLFGLNAGAIAAGTLADARLSANVALLNSSPSFSGQVSGGGDVVGARLKIGSNPLLTGIGATIAGGVGNAISGPNPRYGAIGGGWLNTNASFAAVIAGGQQNLIGTNADHSTIAGGNLNSVRDNAYWSAIGGGQRNSIETGDRSTIGGGYGNTAGDRYATVGGGYGNTASGELATVAGGSDNTAGGNWSFAAGIHAQATNAGAFVWSSGESTYSWGDNTFTVRAYGGARFYTAPGIGAGVQLPGGGGSWSSLSDRNAKENLKPVDTRAILAKVATLPITEWNLKSQPASIRHIGPVAQDFSAAFGVGEDDRHISTSDADGVAWGAFGSCYPL